MLCSGEDDPDRKDPKTSAAFCWLFGAEFFELALVFLSKQIIAIGSVEKLKILRTMMANYLSRVGRDEAMGGGVVERVQRLPRIECINSDDTELESKVEVFVTGGSL